MHTFGIKGIPGRADITDQFLAAMRGDIGAKAVGVIQSFINIADAHGWEVDLTYDEEKGFEYIFRSKEKGHTDISANEAVALAVEVHHALERFLVKKSSSIQKIKIPKPIRGLPNGSVYLYKKLLHGEAYASVIALDQNGIYAGSYDSKNDNTTPITAPFKLCSEVYPFGTVIADAMSELAEALAIQTKLQQGRDQNERKNKSVSP